MKSSGHLMARPPQRQEGSTDKTVRPNGLTASLPGPNRATAEPSQRSSFTVARLWSPQGDALVADADDGLKPATECACIGGQHADFDRTQLSPLNSRYPVLVDVHAICHLCLGHSQPLASLHQGDRAVAGDELGRGSPHLGFCRPEELVKE